MDYNFTNDIIIVGQQAWDTEIGSNCKNIALELSKTNRVLYINSPLDRVTMMRDKADPKVQKRINVIKGREDGLVKIKENLWNYYPHCMVESINWINSRWWFNFFNKINNRKFASSIKQAIKRLNFKDYLLFNDSEMFKAFYLKDFLKPRLSMYYSRDFMVAFDYWKKHGEWMEPLLIAKSDLCFANSEYLADYCRQFNPNSYYVGQGCDIEDFKDARSLPKPADIRKLPAPVIGYVGALNSVRLDADIIAHIAISFPEYTVLLVGPEDDGFKASRLHDIDNVVFIGPRPIKKLPDYINAFDVCINPQLVNPVTIGNYPRKVDEYLAVGKPTVVTATKTMESFARHVYIAETKEEYPRLIKKALIENSQALIAGRIAFASEHTWEHSVKLMAEQISIALKNN
jgi:glycosyltransferase involved in cell wall biosynthesis